MYWPAAISTGSPALISHLPVPSPQLSSRPPPTSLSCVCLLSCWLSVFDTFNFIRCYPPRQQIGIGANPCSCSTGHCFMSSCECVSVWNLVQCPRLTEGSAFGWIGIDISCMASLEWQLFTYLSWQSIRNCRKHYRTVLDTKTELATSSKINISLRFKVFSLIWQLDKRCLNFIFSK